MTQPESIDWGVVLDELRRHGLTVETIAREIFVPIDTVRTWRQCTPQDMKYQRGVRLLALLETVKAQRVSIPHLPEMPNAPEAPRSADARR